VTGGAGGLFAGVLAAGVAGVRTVTLVAGGVACLLAWDAAEYALDLRARVGAAAPTAAAERAHIARTATLAAGAGVGATLAFRVTAGRVPPSAAVAFLAGAFLLAAAARA
jgi:hypothetical protein